MNTKSLIWKTSNSHPDYEVSDCGDVRRADREGIFQRGRRLRGIIDADGYLKYSIHSQDGRKITVFAHFMVADAFIGPRPTPLHQVAHNNGSRLLNTPENLRWASAKDNQQDRVAHNTNAAGVRNGRATITDEDVLYIRERYRFLKLHRLPVKELDERFNLCRSQIIRIARKQAWGHVHPC